MHINWNLQKVMLGLQNLHISLNFQLKQVIIRNLILIKMIFIEIIELCRQLVLL